MFKSEMLFISIFCVILCTAWGQDNKMALYVPPGEVLAFRKNGETCANEFGLDPKDTSKIVTWTLPDDKVYKQFVYCTLLHSNYIVEDGHINYEGASKMIPINGTKEEMLQIYRECDKISLGDVIETGFGLATCYHKNFVLILKKPEA